MNRLWLLLGMAAGSAVLAFLAALLVVLSQGPGEVNVSLEAAYGP
jgi:hypothetical protein